MSLDVYLNLKGTKQEENGSDCCFVYSDNITHNLGDMAGKACIYQQLWCPEEMGITKAEQLICSLDLGLIRLQSDPEYFKRFNPSNGWGTYELLVEFVANYLEACIQYPEATVEVSR